MLLRVWKIILRQSCSYIAIVELDELNISNRIEINGQRLNANISRLNSLNPINVLKRGYAFVSNGKEIVKSVDNVNVGDDLSVELIDGNVIAKVISKEKK